MPTWSSVALPTKGGGHTYLGFSTTSEGVVEPWPSGNFDLLTEEYQDYFRKGFADQGYKLVVQN